MYKPGYHSTSDQLARNGVNAMMARRIMSRRMARGMGEKTREGVLQASGWPYPTAPTQSQVCIVSGLDGVTLVCWTGEDDCGVDM
jgi:hypothetical protein